MSEREPLPPLTLSVEEMRELGHTIVDLIVEHFATLPDQPVTGRASRRELESRLREPIPTDPRPASEVVEQLRRDVLPFAIHVDHPRFFAFVPGPSNFVGAMADALATGLNHFQGTWLASSGPSALELVTVDWLREICDLPEEAGGLFVSGGSMANVTCLAVARHVRLGDRTGKATIYLSDQTHSSVERGLRVLGFSEERIRRIPTDAEFRMEMPALEAAVREDRERGLDPFCVVANAGTTNTGAIDPLDDLADLCAAEGMWLHADGAYGAAAAMAPRGKELLRGLERVDSLSLDPHKWLFQPFECGCALVRDRRWLADTFAVHPEYLQDTHGAEEEVNFGERGIQLTRQWRALKLWMSLQVFGRDAFENAIERGIQLAERAESALRSTPDWEILSPARLGVVCFRRIAPDRSDAELDALQSALVSELFADGYAFLSSTRLRGRTVLRMCTINPRTTDADIDGTINRLTAYDFDRINRI
jgi:glutamate/tyrosine decarboxylase-like PLP-dependent enzyme